MSILFGIIVASFLNWQEKYNHCEFDKFKGDYCATAKVLHERDLKFRSKK
jgi:hypothetical protein